MIYKMKIAEDQPQKSYEQKGFLYELKIYAPCLQPNTSQCESKPIHFILFFFSVLFYFFKQTWKENIYKEN